MKHLIRKQVIDFVIDDREDAYRVQQLVSERYWNSLIKILERALDSVSTPGQSILINRLEIDLGVISERDIEKNRWDALLFKKLTEELNRLMSDPSPHEPVSRQSENLSYVRQWLYYMEWGHLPWNAGPVNDNWYQEVIQCLATEFDAITELRSLIRKSKMPARRIIAEHKKEFIISIIEVLSALPQGEISAVIEEFKDIIAFVREEDRRVIKIRDADIENDLWCFIIRFAAINEPVLKLDNIIPALIDFYKVDMTQGLVLPSRFLHPQRITAKYLSSIKEKQANQQEDNMRVGQQGDQYAMELKLPSIPEESVGKKMNDEEVIVSKLFDPGTEEAGEMCLNTLPEKEGIFVCHAGLVLLHPFLDRFFTNLGLVRKGGFVDLYAHQKALYLLHYLSTGNLKGAEHELVTAKIMCAYPLQKPVDHHIEINDEEINEANELLMNVIGQWDVLKNSSPQGLREGFLQRNGKYTVNNEKGCLHIESHAIDILLDHLPWTISIVKLPWMNDPLWVEWR